MDDKKSGQGVFVGKDGEIYKGMWDDNVLSGSNVVTESAQQIS